MSEEREDVVVEVPQVEIRLFVGKVPKAREEDEIRDLFAQYGDIVECSCIRDKGTSASKGCFFVKMRSIEAADRAIRELNGKHVMDQALGPITVKYATGEHERLGLPADCELSVEQPKVFVGGLTKGFTSEDLQALFSPYGKPHDMFIMTEKGTNAGRGCGFIRFETKEQALYAISQTHGKITVPGGNRPLEVKFAKVHGQGSASQSAAMPMGMGMGMPMGMQMQMPRPMPGMPPAQPTWVEYLTPEGRPYYVNTITRLTQWERPAEMNLPPGGPGPAGTTAGGTEKTGPPGANVFIYHVPNEWSDNDLSMHFAHYGPLVSARIVTEPGSNRGRGFAFVSYSSVQSAVNACNGMNGFQIAGKRLKVMIKKGEEQHAQAFTPQAVGLPQPAQAQAAVRQPSPYQPQPQPIQYAQPVNPHPYPQPVQAMPYGAQPVYAVAAPGPYAQPAGQPQPQYAVAAPGQYAHPGGQPAQAQGYPQQQQMQMQMPAQGQQQMYATQPAGTRQATGPYPGQPQPGAQPMYAQVSAGPPGTGATVQYVQQPQQMTAYGHAQPATVVYVQPTAAGTPAQQQQPVQAQGQYGSVQQQQPSTYTATSPQPTQQYAAAQGGQPQPQTQQQGAPAGAGYAPATRQAYNGTAPGVRYAPY